MTGPSDTGRDPAAGDGDAAGLGLAAARRRRAVAGPIAAFRRA
jgi:hypothetical protein